jgi:hypothetical protein
MMAEVNWLIFKNQIGILSDKFLPVEGTRRIAQLAFVIYCNIL